MITPLEHKMKLLRDIKPSMRYDGKEDFHLWQKRLREKLVDLLGLPTMEKCDPQFKIEYDKTLDDHREIRFTLQSEEGYTFPSVLRLPLGFEGKIPVVICLQGHSTGFHISLGQPKYEGDEGLIAGGDRDFAVRINKEGYAALAIEQRNFGECGGTPQTNCYTSTLNSLLQGRTTIGERVWDIMTVIDNIGCFDFLDLDKIYCMGNSGGGTATYYAACIDERIKMAMPSCAVCTYKDSIGPLRHCTCNYIPKSALYFDMGDLAGLIAPRPLIIVNGIGDTSFPHEGVVECFEIAKELYRVAGAEENCAMVTGPEGHRFYADLSWPVFKKLEKR